MFARTAEPAGSGVAPYSVRIDTGEFALAANDIVAPAQHALWASAWAKEVNSDTLVVHLADSAGKPALVLPLEVVNSGRLKVARFIGGSHANGNFPIIQPGTAIPRATIDALTAALHAKRPDIDVLALERMATDLDGVANPLLTLPSQPSPNIALSVNLEGGFDAVQERSPNRKGRRYRAQARKFESLGGARRLVAASEEDVARFLDAFFAMKAERFRVMGISDVFAEPQVQAFFRRLFTTALGTDDFALVALEVSGKLRAVTGHSRCGNRLICEFGAIANDEMATHSPGDFLFYENIRVACEEGFVVYDFSVGDEPYKRAWCDIEQQQADVMLPLTARGRFFSRWLSAKAALKGKIKGNPVLWPIAKRMRKLLRGR